MNNDEPIYTMNWKRSGGPAFWLPETESLPEDEEVITSTRISPDIRAEGREWLAEQRRSQA